MSKYYRVVSEQNGMIYAVLGQSQEIEKYEDAKGQAALLNVIHPEINYIVIDDKNQTVEGKTTLVGMAELRKLTKEILEKLKSSRVILTKRNKPVGVILDYEEFQNIEEIIEALEDYILGTLAKERAKRKGKKVVSLEEAEKRLGLT